MHSLNNRPTGLELDDAAEIARIYKRHQLARRVRRVSRIAIIATKNDLNSRQRRILSWQRKLSQATYQLRTNQYRIAAACALVVFGVSTILPSFLQADTSKSTSLNAQVKALIGDSRDDASKYLTFDSKKSAYTFEVPEVKASETSEHTGRNTDAYTTDIPVNVRDGLTVTDTKTKIAVTLKPDFYMTPARKTDGNNIVYRSGNKQIIYTHKYNGLKEDIVLSEFQDSSMSFSFTLRLPSGVEARLDERGNIGIYSSDPTLFGNISFDKEQDRQSVEKAREKGEKNNLIMTIPYPVVKDSTGTEFSDRAKFTLSDRRSVKSSVDTSTLPAEVAKSTAGQIQLNEYSLTLRADNLKNLTYPISIDPTMQVRDAADFGRLNIESGSDLDTTNSLIKRGGLTGGGLVSWNTNTTHLPYSAQKHGATIYNGYLYIHGGLSATGNDYRVYYASINTSTGVIGAFNPASDVVGAGRSTHAIFAYNGFFYIVGNGSAGGTGPTTYAKINSDGTLGTFAAATNQIIGRRFASYSLSNGYIYVAGGCTAFSSAVDTGDCTAFASTVEYAQIKPDGSLSAWQNTSAFTGNRMLGSMTTYNGYLYYAGGQDDGDLINSAVTFNTVFVSRQNSDGSLSSWSTNTMPGAKQSHQSVAYNGYIYEVGGYNAVVYYAPIYADGSIGTWITDTPLPAQYAIGVLLAANNNLFLVGGSSPNTGDEILVAQVRAAGEISSWVQDTGTSFSTARRRHATAVYNGYIYVAGGCGTSSCGSGDALSDVQYAPLNADGSVGTWAATSSLTTQRAGCSIAIYNGVMYVSGGFQNLLQIFTTSVDRAVINANGTLGAFSADSNNFSQGRSQHTSVAYNGFLYIIGGRNSQNSSFSSVEKAQIASNGSLGTFSIDNPLNVQRAMGQVSVYGNKMYLVGGCTDFVGGSGCSSATSTIELGTVATNGSVTWSLNAANFPQIYSSNTTFIVKGYLYATDTSTTYYSRLNSDGTLNNWIDQPNPGVSHTESFSGANAGDFLYITGGLGAGSRVDYGQINNGGPGGVGSWGSKSSIATARHRFGATYASNGYLYVAGGCTSTTDACSTGSNARSDIQLSKLGNGGTMTAYSTSTTALPRATSGHSLVAYKDYIYLIGGIDNTGTIRQSVEYARVAANGTFLADAGCGTTWCITASLPLTASGPVATVYGDGIYVARGASTTTIYYSSIANNGSVAAWQTGSALQIARSGASIVAYAGYLYVLGGFDSGSNVLGSVEIASINSNNSLGAFTYTTPLNAPRWGGSVSVYNGNIYAFGGTGSGLYNTDFAPILQNGHIGTWSKTNSFATPRFQNESVAVNGFVYLVGGCSNGSCSALLGDTQSASVQSIPRIGQLSRLYDFDVGVRPTKLITRGTKRAGSVTGTTYTTTNAATGSTTLDNAQSITDVGYNGQNALSISLGVNRTLSRYLYLRYFIDDSQGALFPDIGNESTITDFDMYYTSNPGTRLRGGRTFTNGADRGLEANPQ